MKKLVLLMAVACLMLTSCGKPEPGAGVGPKEPEKAATSQTPSDGAEKQEPARVVHPLSEAVMENLTDAILSVSLNEGDAYVDDTGKMQMKVSIFTYDKYDMMDISELKVGDILVTHAGEVEVTGMERGEGDAIRINGGLEEGGFDLVTDESGIFYETGFDDAKNWYEVGEATIRVSADFEGHDSYDPEQGEVVLYPGSFLIGEVTNYNFTPSNTTIRVEGGQIVELNRTYTP